MVEKEYIEREAALRANCYFCSAHLKDDSPCDEKCADYMKFMEIPAADVRPVPDGGIGEMSDGYHTFNGLYYQRMVLFAALVKAHKDEAWKSWRHEGGELCFGGGWFIVGIDTPEGSYTYHYEDKDWDRFECEELPVAKHWDGHTEEDVTRLLSLPVGRPVVRGKWVEHNYDPEYLSCDFSCSECNVYLEEYYFGEGQWPGKTDHYFCPNCGADMREES